jgi:hypothetical protein
MVGRAAAVIVAAVLIGVLVLRSESSPARVPPSTSTTTTTTAPRSATTTTVSHADVKVLVANGSTTNNVASGYSTVLQHGGWDVLAPTNAKPPPRATSAVYYAANKRSDADAVAAAFGLPLSDVFPISSATPVANVGGADVVLVIGLDLAAKTPPSTVPPTTTTAPKTTTSTTAHS